MTVNKNRPRSELDGRVTWLGFLSNMINMLKKIEEKMGEMGKNPYSFMIILGLSFIVSILLTIYLKKKNML